VRAKIEVKPVATFRMGATADFRGAFVNSDVVAVPSQSDACDQTCDARTNDRNLCHVVTSCHNHE
jgi:hypothetical protein